jgi:hypothetical protein
MQCIVLGDSSTADDVPCESSHAPQAFARPNTSFVHHHQIAGLFTHRRQSNRLHVGLLVDADRKARPVRSCCGWKLCCQDGDDDGDGSDNGGDCGEAWTGRVKIVRGMVERDGRNVLMCLRIDTSYLVVSVMSTALVVR